MTPELVPFRAQVVVNHDATADTLVAIGDPVVVPFGGGVMDAWVVPCDAAPVLFYRTVPPWAHPYLDTLGVAPSEVMVVAVAAAPRDIPFHFLRFSPSLVMEVVPFSEGVLCVFRLAGPG